MSVLRLGQPVTYRVIGAETLLAVEREGVVRDVGGPIVWCGPSDVPLWQCDPVPYAQVEPR